MLQLQNTTQCSIFMIHEGVCCPLTRDQ